MTMPVYGQRLIPNVVDEYAATDPTRPFAFVPVSDDPKDGFRPISFKQFSNAVNFLAHRLIERAKVEGPQQDDFPTVAYIGPSDMRYPIVMLACIKAHHKPLFISPRNSLEAQLSLFKATNCSLLLYADSFHFAIQPWIQSHPMQVMMAPSPDTWLQSTPSPILYDKPFEQARWDPLVVLHTSGSTGIPKPVVVRQGGMAVVDGLRNGPNLHGSPSIWQHWGTCTRLFVPMPLFHGAGIVCLMLLGVYYGVPSVLSIPSRPMSADLVTECLVYSGADTTILPPSIIEDLSTTERGVKALVGLKITGFGGGNLAPAVGDALIDRGASLLNVIASTEMMYLIHFQRDPKLWQYFIINSKEMGADFRLVSTGEDGLGTYEMFIRRIHPTEPGRQALFYTFPEKTQWSTGDLYKPHLTLPDHWPYQGRADNIVVFSTGEKLNPVTIEESVLGHPGIKGALVVGQQRFQPALILEPTISPKDAAAAEALIDDVWPLVQEVNKVTMAHGRIVRRLIAVSDPAAPFVRTPKGSIQRLATVKIYKDFIDQVYQREDEGIDETVDLDLSSQDALAQSIVDVLVARTGDANVQPDTDLFSIGVDSMQVISLSKLLRSGLEAAGVTCEKNTVATRVIYANSTPRSLAGHLYSTVRGEESGKDAKTREVEALAGMISKYTADLPAPNRNQSDPLDEGQTVIVTGTTGSLGAYMLDRLISNPRVSKILALNRGDDGGSSRQPAFNAARGLITDFSKVDFIRVDLSQPLLGLDQAKYAELLAAADRIIHNAWPVNFNMSIDSFEPHVRGVRHLVDLSNRAAKRAPIVFISSISTAGGWASSEPVSEQQIEDLTLPQMGYGQSKLAGSLILDAATERSGVLTATIRVGQVAGPRAKEGVWNRQEFIPSLIASSVYLGILPESIGPMDVVDWVPVEDVAGLVLDVPGIAATVPLSSILGYFHCVNPSATSWAAVAKVLKQCYDGRIKEIVPLEMWVDELEKSVSNGVAVDGEKNPAIKLIDTYRGMVDSNREGLGHVYFDMARAAAYSPTMRKMGPIDADSVRNWCKQWGY